MNTVSSSGNKRRLEELNTDETARLCLLNEKLSAAEAWIHQRAQQALTAYYAAGNVKRHQFNENVLEDVDIDSKVTCVLRSDHPEYRADDDNIVAELDAFARTADVCEEGFSFSEFGCVGKLPPLVDVRLCWLFHDLVDHVLHRDWHRALDIGEIWIDVKLVQQRIISW